MTKVFFLESLCEYTRKILTDLRLPVRAQGEEKEPSLRQPEVYAMRLPDSMETKRKAPYIIHQIITSEDAQSPGEKAKSSVTVRSIFCVYNRDEQEGALDLLNVTERLRIHLLKDRIIDSRYELDLAQKMETIFYPDDTKPYFAGEMKTVWKIPAIEREVCSWVR